MKKFNVFLFSVAAFLFFSCNQLNLTNPAGAVSVCLSGSSSRMIVADGQNKDNFEDISYKIFLYSSSGTLVDSKSGDEGATVEFSEIPGGTYVVRCFCYTNGNGIAADYKTVEVKGGEITPVELELTYNRLSKLDKKLSSIRYEGDLEFRPGADVVSEDQFFANIKSEISTGLFADLFFTNGWKETVRSGFEIKDILPVEVTQDGNKGEMIGTRGDSYTGGPTTQIGSGGYFVQNPFDCTVMVFHATTGLSKEIRIKVLPSETEVVVNPFDPEDKPVNITIGLSEANPCVDVADLLTAITNVDDDGVIYISGKDNGTGYVFELSETRTITKSLTIKSAVENLTVSRTSTGAYIFVSNDCELKINSSVGDKKIVFTDGETGNTNNFIMGEEGKVVAYNVQFESVNTGAVKVGEVELHDCEFKNISSEYGAIHIASGKSATLDSCTFSGNSTYNENASGYGDVYLAKDSAVSTLTLSGNVSTDIGIYVDNEIGYDDPKKYDPNIALDDISFTGETSLRVKVGKFPDGGYENINLFEGSAEVIDGHVKFAVNNGALEFILKKFVYSGTDPYCYDYSDQKYIIYVN